MVTLQRVRVVTQISVQGYVQIPTVLEVRMWVPTCLISGSPQEHQLQIVFPTIPEQRIWFEIVSNVWLVAHLPDEPKMKFRPWIIFLELPGARSIKIENGPEGRDGRTWMIFYAYKAYRCTSNSSCVRPFDTTNDPSVKEILHFLANLMLRIVGETDTGLRNRGWGAPFGVITSFWGSKRPITLNMELLKKCVLISSLIFTWTMRFVVPVSRRLEMLRIRSIKLTKSQVLKCIGD